MTWRVVLMAKDKIRILHFKPTKEIDLLEVDVQSDTAIVKKGEKEPLFSNECIYNIKAISQTPVIGRLANRLRKRESTLIYVDGKAWCEKTKPGGEIIEPINDKERLDFVKKEVLKTLGKFQLMKPWMFIGLLIPIAIVIILQIVLMRGGRPF